MSDLPDWLDTDAWYAYREMRKQMGKTAPFTEYAAKLILRKLEDFYRQGYDANSILETSIERSWRGVFICADTPRRQLTTGEKANVAKIAQLVARVVK